MGDSGVGTPADSGRCRAGRLRQTHSGRAGRARPTVGRVGSDLEKSSSLALQTTGARERMPPEERKNYAKRTPLLAFLQHPGTRHPPDRPPAPARSGQSQSAVFRSRARGRLGQEHAGRCEGGGGGGGNSRQVISPRRTPSITRRHHLCSAMPCSALLCSGPLSTVPGALCFCITQLDNTHDRG